MLGLMSKSKKGCCRNQKGQILDTKLGEAIGGGIMKARSNKTYGHVFSRTAVKALVDKDVDGKTIV